MSFASYLHLVAVLVAMIWTMIEREKALRNRMTGDFLSANPEFRDYKYFWELYGLFHQGKSAATLNETQLAVWKNNVAHCLKNWGEERHKIYELNLEPHANLDSCLAKIEEQLNRSAGRTGDY